MWSEHHGMQRAEHKWRTKNCEVEGDIMFRVNYREQRIIQWYCIRKCKRWQCVCCIHVDWIEVVLPLRSERIPSESHHSAQPQQWSLNTWSLKASQNINLLCSSYATLEYYKPSFGNTAPKCVMFPIHYLCLGLYLTLLRLQACVLKQIISAIA